MRGEQMTVKVMSYHLFIKNIHSRMPFRYGIAELTAVPHLFLRLECLVDGHLMIGCAADSLIPKWFTKDVNTPYQQDVEQMLNVIEEACRAALQAEQQKTPFDLWQSVYSALRAWAFQISVPPLLWGFGASLVERAVIDAFCRRRGKSFHLLLRDGSLGLQLSELHPSLSSEALASLLPEKPLARIAVRHTIGLSDPLSGSELPASESHTDGLPRSLQAAIRFYGLSYFKIKLSGNWEADLDRLRRVASLLEQECPNGYAVTLDGNEQFEHPDLFKEFWCRFRELRDLQKMHRSVLFVEQPVHRSRALSEDVRLTFSQWTDRPSMIIDESDELPESVKVALHLGYQGASHKNCKGVFKGIANACLLESLRRTQPGRTLILSGEDLVNIGPVALLQDLAVMATLGVRHVERNGHHYFAGLNGFQAGLQSMMCKAHSDLYQDEARGFAALQIANGMIKLDSVTRAPFGLGIEFDPQEWFIPKEDWRFETLQEETAQF